MVGAWDRVSDFPGIEPPDVPRFPILVSEPLKLTPRDRRPEVEAIQRSIARLPFDSFPFWLATTSSHTHSWDPDAPPNGEWYNPQRKRGRVVISDPDAAEHVHLLIGGISFYRVREILSTWPGRKKGPRAVYRVWNCSITCSARRRGLAQPRRGALSEPHTAADRILEPGGRPPRVQLPHADQASARESRPQAPEDIMSRILPKDILPNMEAPGRRIVAELDLERCEEALGHGVVPTIAISRIIRA